MQDNSTPPPKNISAIGKYIYPNVQQPPKNKRSAKKKYSTINFIHLIHKTCQILSTFTQQCHCLHLVSTFIFLTLTPNIPILFTVIPQHFIISPIQCIRPFSVTSGETCLNAVTIHTD
jgi:hypothetical protein